MLLRKISPGDNTFKNCIWHQQFHSIMLLCRGYSIVSVGVNSWSITQWNHLKVAALPSFAGYYQKGYLCNFMGTQNIIIWNISNLSFPSLLQKVNFISGGWLYSNTWLTSGAYRVQFEQPQFNVSLLLLSMIQSHKIGGMVMVMNV